MFRYVPAIRAAFLAPIPRSNPAFLRVRAVYPPCTCRPATRSQLRRFCGGFPFYNKPLDVYGITVHTGIVKG
jgi:hypothetical protein